MNWIYIIIIGILAYIAYQLYQMNRTKEIERDEKTFQDKFPNLSKYASEDAKKALRAFLKQNENSDDVAKYLYTARFAQINRAIENETDATTKEKMIAAKETITKDLKQNEVRLQKAVDEKTATRWEADYVLWEYLSNVNEKFPDIDVIVTLDDLLVLRGFKGLLSVK